MDEATAVNITDVFADAVQVPARDVRVGDYVFSTMGERDRVIHVSSLRNNSRKRTIVPERLWPLVLPVDDAITIVRGE